VGAVLSFDGDCGPPELVVLGGSDGGCAGAKVAGDGVSAPSELWLAVGLGVGELAGKPVAGWGPGVVPGVPSEGYRVALP